MFKKQKLKYETLDKAKLELERLEKIEKEHNEQLKIEQSIKEINDRLYSEVLNEENDKLNISANPEIQEVKPDIKDEKEVITEQDIKNYYKKNAN